MDTFYVFKMEFCNSNEWTRSKIIKRHKTPWRAARRSVPSFATGQEAPNRSGPLQSVATPDLHFLEPGLDRFLVSDDCNSTWSAQNYYLKSSNKVTSWVHEVRWDRSVAAAMQYKAFRINFPHWKPWIHSRSRSPSTYELLENSERSPTGENSRSIFIRGRFFKGYQGLKAHWKPLDGQYSHAGPPITMALSSAAARLKRRWMNPIMRAYGSTTPIQSYWISDH